MLKQLHLILFFFNISAGRNDTGRSSHGFLCLLCINRRVMLFLMCGCISSFFTFIYSSGFFLILYLFLLWKTPIHRHKVKYGCHAALNLVFHSDSDTNYVFVCFNQTVSILESITAIYIYIYIYIQQYICIKDNHPKLPKFCNKRQLKINTKY